MCLMDEYPLKPKVIDACLFRALVRLHSTGALLAYNRARSSHGGPLDSCLAPTLTWPRPGGIRLIKLNGPTPASTNLGPYSPHCGRQRLPIWLPHRHLITLMGLKNITCLHMIKKTTDSRAVCVGCSNQMGRMPMSDFHHPLQRQPGSPTSG